MKKVFALMALLALSACDHKPPGNQLSCAQIQPNTLGAVYTISHIQTSTETASPIENKLTLWRLNKRVAHQYESPAITKAWAQDAKGGLLMWQFFDDAKRTIEYEAQHFNPDHQQQAWEEKWQVVSSALIDQMQSHGDTGSKCNKKKRYSLEKNHRKMTLEWLTTIQLPARFEIKETDKTTVWTLRHLISDKDVITRQFSQRDQWQSTDYADIGDNESDPFLLSMINLGFISHGAEGFYNSDGEMIHREGGHAH